MDTKSHNEFGLNLITKYGSTGDGRLLQYNKMSLFKSSHETKELRVISALQMLFFYNNQQLSNSHMDGCDQKVKVKLQIHQK